MARPIGLSIGCALVVTLAGCYSGGGGRGSEGTDGGDGGDAGDAGDGADAGDGGGDDGSGGDDGDGSGGDDGDSGGDGADGTGDGGDDGTPPGTPLDQRIDVVDVTVPFGVKEGVDNWRIWGRGDLNVAPVFTVPTADCGTLVCASSGSESNPSAHVVRLDASDQIVNTFDVGSGVECRGLAAEPDGSFAVLLWSDGSDTIRMDKFDSSGAPGWSTGLTNADNTPDDFGIGEARMEFGNGRYGAYYHVHSNDGHEGDTLKWVSASNGAEDTEWSWGCSHSMSNLLRFSPGAGDFLPVCVTDCYPGTNGDFGSNAQGGIFLWADRDYRVIDVDAGCNGDVAGEVGSAALSPGGWKLVFNAHQAPLVLGQGSYDENTMNQDIGFSSIGGGPSAGGIVWLTDTGNIDEADSSIARWQPAGDGDEQYIVGWAEGEEATVHRLARIDAAGTFLEGPIDVSAQVSWGRRDDPFRQHVNLDIIWTWFDSPGSTTLHVARVDSGEECG